MNRGQALVRQERESFDVLVIGGGATGLGCALDAASRGYRTALVETRDFASGTSSRSTKLIHGGVRYLRQGNIKLVREALRERAVLLHNAPDIVHPLAFFVQARNPLQRLLFAAGFRFYDALAGAADPLPRSTMQPGGVQYFDAQFDDARLAIAIACTASSHGAAIANYVRADSFLYRGGAICGAMVTDIEAQRSFEIRAKTVINAAGVFADAVRRLDDAHAAPLLRCSRGSHIVVPQNAVPTGGRALLVPKTSDGRVLFAIPWHGCTLIGTTDIACAEPLDDPVPSAAEIDWILKSLRAALGINVERSAICSAFAGLRPLLSGAPGSTAGLSREHALVEADSGLITIAGGKWTTYRVMAEQAVDAAARRARLPAAPSRTRALALQRLPADPGPVHAADVEMARTLDDYLARRMRLLFTDVREALVQAGPAAQALAHALNRDAAWSDEQVRRFESAARMYMPV